MSFSNKFFCIELCLKKTKKKCRQQWAYQTLLAFFSVGGHISCSQKSMAWRCSVGNNNARFGQVKSMHGKKEKISFFSFGCVEVLIWSPAVYRNAALYWMNWKKRLVQNKWMDCFIVCLTRNVAWIQAFYLLTLSQSCAWIPFAVRKQANKQTKHALYKDTRLSWLKATLHVLPVGTFTEHLPPTSLWVFTPSFRKTKSE